MARLAASRGAILVLTRGPAPSSLTLPRCRPRAVPCAGAFPRPTDMQPHLRPTDAGEILDGAVSLYRRHRGAFVPAGALMAPRVAAALTPLFDGLCVRAEALDVRVPAGRPAAA
jgi:hypothetical protein